MTRMTRRILKSRRMVQKLPREMEFGREMSGQGFDAEGFGGVMAPVEHVHAQFFGQRISPMRSFAGDESIHAFGCGFLEVATGASRDDTNAAANRWSTRNYQCLCASRSLQTF